MPFSELTKDLDVEELPDEVAAALGPMSERYNAAESRLNVKMNAALADIGAAFKKHGVIIRACGCCGGPHLMLEEYADDSQDPAGYLREIWGDLRYEFMVEGRNVVDNLLDSAREYLKWRARREKRPSKFARAEKQLTQALAAWREFQEQEC